ncbi:hypothetical protein STTU_3210 [Streptomyces sp. Tu6071]|nr:hypothetical protein STTU_3210 [Streptomyces sp. Tu6071]
MRARRALRRALRRGTAGSPPGRLGRRPGNDRARGMAMSGDVVLYGGMVVVLVAVVLSRLGTRRQARAFEERYGSYESFRRQVDAGRVREVARERGKIAAVKEVRERHPGVSLVMAKRYVDQLPV